MNPGRPGEGSLRAANIVKLALTFSRQPTTVIPPTPHQLKVHFLKTMHGVVFIYNSLQKHQDKVLVIAEDYAMLFKVNQLWPGYAVLIPPAPDSQTAHKFGSQGFFNFTSRGPRHLLHILELGYNVMYNDVDMVWLADPFPYLQGVHDVYFTDDMAAVSESSRGKMSGNSESPMTAAVPELELCAFALIVDPPHVASKVTLTVGIEGDHPNEAASVTEASKLGSIGEMVTNRGMGGVNWTTMAGDLSVGMPVRPTRPRTLVSPHRWYQGANQNRFSPLSGLGSGKGFCFGERDNSTKWKHSKVNPSGFFHGDPNEQKELEVIQEVDEGEVRGSEVKNSKWVDLYLLPQAAFPTGGLYFKNKTWVHETKGMHVIIHNNYITGFSTADPLAKETSSKPSPEGKCLDESREKKVQRLMPIGRTQTTSQGPQWPRVHHT
nr:isoform 2 of udp-d-xylose:l-fucose alpha-1,3-d-xylosyltransferase mgp4 [Quercus suber]